MKADINSLLADKLDGAAKVTPLAVSARPPPLLLRAIDQDNDTPSRTFANVCLWHLADIATLATGSYEPRL
jgi:hypothetical protein